MSEDAPQYGPMTERQARKILRDYILCENSLSQDDEYPHIDWLIGNKTASIDGEFTADQLEAIAWWMRNKRE